MREAVERVGSPRYFSGTNAPYIWVKGPEELTSWQTFDRILNGAKCLVGSLQEAVLAQGEGYFPDLSLQQP